MIVIWLNSGFGDAPEILATDPRLQVVRAADFGPETLAGARGLITGNLLDQDAMLTLAPALEAFLDAGGRWFFNGHMLRPILRGIGRYAPMSAPKRADFDQIRLAPHPIFAGIDIHALETNRGVAGFYGRGANPLPEGAIAVTGLRGGTLPVDWVWCRPGGGAVFSHAGNDLGQMGLDHPGLADLLKTRIIDWAAGGACLCV